LVSSIEIELSPVATYCSYCSILGHCGASYPISSAPDITWIALSEGSFYILLVDLTYSNDWISYS